MDVFGVTCLRCLCRLGRQTGGSSLCVMTRSQNHLKQERLEPRRLFSIDLSIDVDPQLLAADPGDELSLSVHVANMGTESAHGARVRAEIPTGFVASCECNSFAVDTSLAAIGKGIDGLTIDGWQGNDLLTGVSHLGDINGDGIDDLLVSALGARIDKNDRDALTEAGELYVLFGGGEHHSGSFDLSKLDGTNGFRVPGYLPSGKIGALTLFNGIGDFNGDGFHDFAVSDGRQTHVVFGREHFEPVLNLLEIDGKNGFVIDAGGRVDGMGDINGDGLDDLLLGTFGFAGDRSYIVFGSKDEDWEAVVATSDLDGSKGFSIFGAGGLSVSLGGDFNGDGVDDIAMTALGTSEVAVIYGSATIAERIADVLNIDKENGFKIATRAPGHAEFVGDINGDGLADLALNNGTQDVVLFGSNTTAPELSADLLPAERGFVINHAIAGSVFGAAGDVNGDGIADLILGRSHETVIPSDFPGFGSEGRVYVIFGSSNFQSTVDITELDGTDGFRLNGFQGEGAAGHDVGGVGDFNNDGIDDVAVGAPTTNGFAGQIYVVYGQATTQTGKLDRLVDIPANESVTFTIHGLRSPDDIAAASIYDVAVESDSTQEDINRSDNNDSYKLVRSSSLLADIDRNGVVGFSDFIILSSNFGRNDGVGPSEGDLDGDGKIAFSDFIALSAVYANKLV